MLQPHSTDLNYHGGLQCIIKYYKSQTVGDSEYFNEFQFVALCLQYKQSPSLMSMCHIDENVPFTSCFLCSWSSFFPSLSLPLLLSNPPFLTHSLLACLHRLVQRSNRNSQRAFCCTRHVFSVLFGTDPHQFEKIHSRLNNSVQTFLLTLHFYSTAVSSYQVCCCHGRSVYSTRKVLVQLQYVTFLCYLTDQFCRSFPSKELQS